MTDAKALTHTRGPWVIRDEDGLTLIDAIEVGSHGYIVADVLRSGEKHTRGEEEANARLIAAAPALLEALRRLEGTAKLLLAGKPCRDVTETLAEVDAALALVDGAK